MQHKATPRFWSYYQALPESVRAQADKNFKQLKKNPAHPSLHFKNVGKFYSVRVNLRYRALAVKQEESYVWVWIGSHRDYEKLL